MDTFPSFSTSRLGPGQPSNRTDCIDLRQRFGKEYRIGRDPTYYVDTGPHANRSSPWLLTIPCRHGHISPHGGTTLAASTDRRGAIARRLMLLSCCEVYQDGTDGVTVLFDLADFDEVAAIMQPRRRRRLSEAQRQACTERLAKVRPKTLIKVGN